MDKSYITIVDCPICHKDTGELLMDMRLRPQFEMHTITPNPCDKCKKKYLKNGVMLINPDTGALVVLKVSAYERIFNTPVPPKHIAYAEQEVISLLNRMEQ